MSVWFISHNIDNNPSHVDFFFFSISIENKIFHMVKKPNAI